MRANFTLILLGFAVGIALAFGAIYAAYRGSLISAIVMVVCQIAAFVTFLFAILSKRSRARGSSDA